VKEVVGMDTPIYISGVSKNAVLYERFNPGPLNVPYNHCTKEMQVLKVRRDISIAKRKIEIIQEDLQRREEYLERLLNIEFLLIEGVNRITL